MRTTAIICAYNEEKTIKEVLHSVNDCNIIDEIIVVNDGSTDNTKDLIDSVGIDKGLKIVKIHLKENKGKGFAMATGLEYTSNELIVFIDADLSNIQDEHIAKLVNPLLVKMADMVLGQPTETLINYSINPFKSFTGQRSVLKKDILPLIDEMKKSRFGVETLINLYYQSKGARIKYVMLSGLKHPTKFEKTDSTNAVKEFIYEGQEIIKTTLRNINLVSRIIKNTI